MKNSLKALSLLVLLGTAGMASAHEVVVAGSGPRGVAVTASFPGMRLVFGRPGRYCWYQGRYYSRSEWDRYARFHRDRYAYYHNHRGYDRDYRRY